MTLASRTGTTVRDQSGAGLMTSVGMSLPTIVSETDGNRVVAGGNDAGWVSGSPANLGASASVNCVFDLGPDWDQYQFTQIIIQPVGPSSGFNAVQVLSSDTTSANAARRLRDAQTSATPFGTTNVNLPTSSGTQAMYCRPAGRYMIVALTNADAGNAQGATAKVTVVSYPS